MPTKIKKDKMDTTNLTKETGDIVFSTSTALFTLNNIIKQLHIANIDAFKLSIWGQTIARDEISGIIEKNNELNWAINENDAKIIGNTLSVLSEHCGDNNKMMYISVEYEKPNNFFKIDFTPQKN